MATMFHLDPRGQTAVRVSHDECAKGKPEILTPCRLLAISMDAV